MSLFKNNDQSIKNNDESIPSDTEAGYEAIAMQEEIYLEAVEEELRAILIFGDPPPRAKTKAKSPICEASNDPRVAESLGEQLDHAAEELITGDSDDPSTERRGSYGDTENHSHAQRI
jgi:hypothetical protein